MKLAEQYMSTVCNVTGCDAAPTHRAEIVIYAQTSRLHQPAIGYLPLCVCAAHADAEHARALLSEEGKQQIAAQFVRAGRAWPDWKRSFVRWVPLKKE
jgi:hypothetical protein